MDDKHLMIVPKINQCIKRRFKKSTLCNVSEIIAQNKIFIFFIYAILAILWLAFMVYDYYLNPKVLRFSACHYLEAKDDLPNIEPHRAEEHTSIVTNSKHIYFYKLSCEATLSSYQSCAIESAVRLHPEWQINVIFSSAMGETNRDRLKPLNHYNNIRFWRVRLDKYVKETPVASLIRKGILQNTDYPFNFTDELFSLLILYKYSGVYIDTDMVLTRPLDTLASNFAVRDGYFSISEGIVAMREKKGGVETENEVLLKSAMKRIKEKMKDDSYIDVKGILTSALYERCNFAEHNPVPSFDCRRFQIYGPEYFYVEKWKKGQHWRLPSFLLNNKTYGYYLKELDDCLVRKKAIFSVLAKKYCPYNFKMYKNDFTSKYSKDINQKRE